MPTCNKKHIRKDETILYSIFDFIKFLGIFVPTELNIYERNIYVVPMKSGLNLAKDGLIDKYNISENGRGMFKFRLTDGQRSMKLISCL